MNKKNLIKLLSVVAGIILLICFLNPLRWPESILREYVLHITPLGSHFNVVRSQIDERRWVVDSSSRTSGFYDQRYSPPRIVGDSYIRVSLGDYQGFPFRGNVTVFFGFNEEDRLVDIWVWKTWDGL